MGRVAYIWKKNLRDCIQRSDYARILFSCRFICFSFDSFFAIHNRRQAHILWVSELLLLLLLLRLQRLLFVVFSHLEQNAERMRDKKSGILHSVSGWMTGCEWVSERVCIPIYIIFICTYAIVFIEHLFLVSRRFNRRKRRECFLSPAFVSVLPRIPCSFYFQRCRIRLQIALSCFNRQVRS